MSSPARRMQRKALRSRPEWKEREQPTIVHADGGYSTLSGGRWHHFSGRRVAAGLAINRLLDHVLPDRPRKPAKVWRKPAPCLPGRETRQQRRAEARGYDRRVGLTASREVTTARELMEANQ